VKEIYKHKTEINFLRKSIRPAKEIIKSLLNTESTLIDEKNLKYFKDLDDLITQAIESVEVYQNMVNDQLNIYQTNVSNGLNEVMKVLTIFSAFFIPLTFIAGVYGMNFQYFPEIHLKYGYLYFWILMIIISVVLLVYFRRKKWFKF
jgi:magnesium transporter